VSFHFHPGWEHRQTNAALLLRAGGIAVAIYREQWFSAECQGTQLSFGVNIMANEGKLNGKKVAILVEEGFEQVEMTEPRKILEQEWAGTDLISPKSGKVVAFQHDKRGDDFDVDVTLDQARADDYDALVLPGGVMNPDQLRMNPQAVQFVKSFVDSGKPIAAICHDPWTLIEAGGIRGRRMTSYPSLKSDLKNAGAQWSDEEVVTDRGLATSRKPDDLPAFNRKMVEEIAEGIHDGARRGQQGESTQKFTSQSATF
jgi:protease I